MNFEESSLRDELKLTDKFDILNLVIGIVGIVLTNIALYEVIKLTNQISIKLIIFAIMINLILIYHTITVFASRIKIKKQNKYIEYLDAKNKGLMELNDNIRCFKHDFNNIIQAIDGYILIGDMQALKVYFSKLLKECNHIKNLELLTCNQMVNPAIYGVLINKYKIAEDKDIKMNIDILMDFARMQNKSYCLSRVIGILLDNAIEAAVESDEKIVNVQFSQVNSNGRRHIVIENTYKNKDVDTNAIFEKNYTTKLEKGNSGLGLWKVRSMLDKESKIDLITTKDQDMFKQELDIFL